MAEPQATPAAEAETFAFSADINQLLSLIINTFYSNKEVREKQNLEAAGERLRSLFSGIRLVSHVASGWGGARRESGSPGLCRCRRDSCCLFSRLVGAGPGSNAPGWWVVPCF